MEALPTKGTEKSEKTSDNQNNQKSPRNFKVITGEIPLNHRELEKLKGNALAQQQLYQKMFASFFIFRRHGDELIGRLCPPQTYSGISQKPYPVELQNGQTVLIPGNKHLQRIFKRFDLVGKWLKIKYIGDRWTRSRHKMKIYEVYDYTEKFKRASLSPAIEKILSDAAKTKSA